MSTNAGGVFQEIRIPFMGSVENAKILRWLVSEGSVVADGDVVCEIETDKTVLDVTAQCAGRLVKRLEDEGADLKVGAQIALVAPNGLDEAQVSQALGALGGANVSAQENRPANVVSELREHPQLMASPGRILVSPLARRLAAEKGVDLHELSNRLGGRRIKAADIKLEIENRVSNCQAEVSEVRIDSVPMSPAKNMGGDGVPMGYESIPHRRMENSTRRKIIARRLQESAFSAPQLTADIQIDLTRVIDSRNAYNAIRGALGESKVSLLSFFIKAACSTLKQYPQLNSTYTESSLIQWEPINIGIAVDTDDGLIVPVIRNAGEMTIPEIDAAVKELASLSREGKVPVEKLSGGTFTISNPGSVGPVIRAEAILNSPQVALLGFPAVHQAPVVVDKGKGESAIEIRTVVRPSLTFDHRPLDGGTIIRFLSDFKNRLETMVID